MSALSIDFLTVHFGDPKWTRLQVESIARINPLPDFVLGKHLIVDNARDGRIQEELSDCNAPLVEFTTFPIDQDQLDKHGHDHATSLEKGLPLCCSELAVVLDCDSHLASADFLLYLHDQMVANKNDAIAASDPRFESEGLSHPCFLVLNRQAREHTLPWDPNAFGNQSQTGRMIGKVLTKAGLRVHTPMRERQFGGVVGDLYDRQVYHHGSATFAGSSDPRLTSQIHPCANVFQSAILDHGRYHLTSTERLRTALKYRFHRMKKRLAPSSSSQ